MQNIAICEMVSRMTNQICKTATHVSQYIKARGLNQTTVGNILGLTQNAVSDRNRGRTPWRLNELERLADHFGTTVAELVQSSDLAVAR